MVNVIDLVAMWKGLIICEWITGQVVIHLVSAVVLYRKTDRQTNELKKPLIFHNKKKYIFYFYDMTRFRCQ